ncbi:hypothetical protein [Pseudoprimorskyibacter insulae]|uniref:Uncharacterized protein n=1 Tax=Pseudoprimorskyibacter insulae TaxID=1695997 RepID=A0A2R8AN69_9RHOB|nr:hypothetical protein [Pseudoprimorskyibacter insulae]SPF77460.1 hypothetical protein PRI8871_00042 [Pseudoprimorskyibacter insulae]
MFGLVRLFLLLLAAFLGGIFYERGQQQQKCELDGGQWARAGFCQH